METSTPRLLLVSDAEAAEWKRDALEEIELDGFQFAPDRALALLADRERWMALAELAVSISQEWNSSRYGGLLNDARKLLKEAHRE